MTDQPSHFDEQERPLEALVTELGARARALGHDLVELARRLGPPRRRILLVGDGPAFDDLAARFAIVHQVTLAHTAVSAYEVACLNPFDLVLTDRALPDEHDGVWLCRQLHDARPEVSRVLTADATPPDWEAYVQAGVIHRFAIQPVLLVDVEDLLAEEAAP